MSKDYKNRAASPRKDRARHSGPFWFFAGLLTGAFALGLAWLKLDPGLMRSGSSLAQTGIPRPIQETAKTPPVQPGLEFEFPDMLRKMEVTVPEENSDSHGPAVLPPPALPASAPTADSMAQSQPQAVPGIQPQPPVAQSQPASPTRTQSPVPQSRPVPPARPQPLVAQSRPAPLARPQPPPVIQPLQRPTAIPQVAARSTTAPETQPESFVLQLGAFKETNDLERLRARLALLGVETRVQKVIINNNETFHRLRAGPYRSQQDLDTVRRLLTRNNINSVIIRWKG